MTDEEPVERKKKAAPWRKKSSRKDSVEFYDYRY